MSLMALVAAIVIRLGHGRRGQDGAQRRGQKKFVHGKILSGAIGP
jgi:hypothetical protein